MPNNNVSVNRDINFSFRDQYGTLQATIVTGFNASPDAKMDKSVGIDNNVRNVLFHEGWSGKFEYDRGSPVLENYWATLEDDYYKGSNYQGGTITETIQEADGSISQFQFTDVVIKLDDAGDYKPNSIIKQSVSFAAGRRIKISGS